ncbi:hypothetical protein [Paludisphaera mucosa]|uniref:Uncharacterized protein n=1 Tax=Paludisphaera mucosa TaxID=3030827 RepID=A0ABT6FAG9_9BACT|nr:hypothetical protein [Paludisphaera mucosa]MDG3004375.1 hypothetical protein [Paludisphaera mucosa]
MSDSFPKYQWIGLKSRHLRRAHLRRDFHATIDRSDAGSAIIENLLTHFGVLFDGWSKVRAETASRRRFETRPRPGPRREMRFEAAGGDLPARSSRASRRCEPL